MSPEFLTVENLTGIRGQRLLFRDLSFRVEAGQVLSLEGPNGAGKTSLLRMIAGFIAPAAGSIAFGALSEPEERGKRIGWLGHHDAAKPQLTPREVLRFFSELYGAREPIDGVLTAVGLAQIADLPCQYLSAGQKKRLALARLRLSGRPLWLMDEPLAALDNLRKGEILRYIECLRDEIKVPIVYVTHAVEEIVRLAEMVVLMADGKVLATGKPSEVMGRPELRAHAGIFEGGTVIDAKVAAHDLQYDLTTLEFAGGRLIVPGVDALVGEPMRLRVRARDVSIALTHPHDVSLLNVLKGRVVAVTASAGSSCDLRIDVGGVNLAARITRLSADRLKLTAGSEVYALIKAISLDR